MQGMWIRFYGISALPVRKYCDFYICVKCITKPKVVENIWDPHPLHLIYEPGMVSEHEHDFNCEYFIIAVIVIFHFLSAPVMSSRLLSGTQKSSLELLI